MINSEDEPRMGKTSFVNQYCLSESCVDLQSKASQREAVSLNAEGLPSAPLTSNIPGNE